MLELCFSQNADIRFASSGKFMGEAGGIHPRRCLDSHVLLLGCTGTYPIAQEGREYLLSENTFMLLAAHHEHWGTAPAGMGQSHFWCHFYLPETVRQETEEREDTPLLCRIPEYCVLPETEKYRMLFKQLIDAAYSTYSDERNKAAVCDAYMRILLVGLADELRMRAVAEEKSSSGIRRRATVASIREWIRLHLKDGITPGDAAAAFGYNGDYLTQLFRAELGCTVGAYITRLRLEEAKKLLLSTRLRITDVAEQAGFQDEKYFMKCFKKAESVTPSTFRQSYYHEHINKR